MWLHLIKLGGYALMSKEVFDRFQAIQRVRQMKWQRSRRANLVLGAAIGSVAGIAAGVLLAPRAGHETRAQIAVQAGEAFERIKASASEAIDSIHEGRRHQKRPFDDCTYAGKEVLRDTTETDEKVQ